MIHYVRNGEALYAIVIKNSFSDPGIKFVTPDDFSQQLAYMKHAKGKEIQPHLHNKVSRNVHLTQEVLLIKKGKLRVDFYDEDKTYINSHILEEGDVILLSAGGHGFEVLEDVEMIEVKQGPYVGEMDKTRFDAPGIDLKIETFINE